MLKLNASILMAVGLLVVGWSPSAKAVVFNIIYDDTPTQAIDGNIVGTGVLSYSGAPAAGTFALDTLPNLSFSASFLSGVSFTLADLGTPLNEAGILVTDLGGGAFSFVFTGDGFNSPQIGSADFVNGLQFLTHEPTSGITDGVGCCGGNGLVNLYAAGDNTGENFGDYVGSSVIPVPGALVLMGTAVLAFGFVHRGKVR